VFIKAKMNKIRGLQSLLYVNFRIRKKYKVDTVVQNWPGKPLSSSTLHKWISGDRPFPVDQLSNLTNATEDTEYLEYYCDQCGYTLMPKIKDKSTAKIVSQMVRIMQSAIDQKDKE